jgi:hypothetical protein
VADEGVAGGVGVASGDSGAVSWGVAAGCEMAVGVAELSGPDPVQAASRPIMTMARRTLMN